MRACPDIKSLNVPSYLGEKVRDPNAFGKDSIAENVVYLGEGSYACVYGLKSAATGEIVTAIKAFKRSVSETIDDEIEALEAVKYFYADDYATVTYADNTKKELHLLFMVYHDGMTIFETEGWHQFVSPTGDTSLSPGLDVAVCEEFLDTLIGSIVNRALEYAHQGAFNLDVKLGNILFRKGYPQDPAVVFVDWGDSKVIKKPNDDLIEEYGEKLREDNAYRLAIMCRVREPE
ncbi:hypothetical protein FRB99_008850 [Tulasnella sp. 403]|nr:hypothetical protein FRB99_008850 [Tulasnella sp. 403]